MIEVRTIPTGITDSERHQWPNDNTRYGQAS